MTYEISNYDLLHVNCEGPYGEWLLDLNVVCTIWVPIPSEMRAEIHYQKCGSFVETVQYNKNVINHRM